MSTIINSTSSIYANQKSIETIDESRYLTLVLQLLRPINAIDSKLQEHVLNVYNILQKGETQSSYLLFSFTNYQHMPGKPDHVYDPSRPNDRKL